MYNSQVYLYDITDNEWVTSFNSPLAKSTRSKALAIGLGLGIGAIVIVSVAVLILRKKIEGRRFKIAKVKQFS